MIVIMSLRVPLYFNEASLLGSCIKDLTSVSGPMDLAINLAMNGIYSVSPNPLVGAVIVKDDIVLGYGYHCYPGDHHAEVKALSMAKDYDLKESVLYVTLEPCNHFGRTPPCVDAILASPIKKVCIGALDPNPLMQGKSVEILRSNGIEVEVGMMSKEAEKQNEVFFHYHKKNRPFVVAKWAMSINGVMSTVREPNSDKVSRSWITGEQARHHVHLLRNRFDAIMVGSNTALFDNPELTVRVDDHKLHKKRQPLRIVLDAFGVLPVNLKVFTQEPDNTLVLCASSYENKKKLILKARGVSFIETSLDNNRLLIKEAFVKLGKMGITSIMVEGGSTLLQYLFCNNLVNKFYCYIAPKFFAFGNAVSSFNQLTLNNTQANHTENIMQSLQFTQVCNIGEDVLLIGDVKCSQD